MDRTAKELVKFLDFAGERGLVPRATAGALRSASTAILQAAEPEGWEELDIGQVDVEDFGKRFERLKATQFKPQSLHVYKARFKNAVKMFLDYAENPSTWKYTAERPASARKKSGSPVGTLANSSTNGGAASARPVVENNGQPMIQYPYPLRPGLLVQLNLPADLTKSEAKRLGTFVDSLVIEELKMLPAGTPEPVSN